MSPIPGTPSPLKDMRGCAVGHFFTSTPVTNAVPNTVVGSSLVRTDCLRVSVLRLMSNCLIIQLLRFQHDYTQQMSSKVLTQVEFPLTGLNLRSLTLEDLNTAGSSSGMSDNSRRYCGGFPDYELFAFCVHQGGTSLISGHYLVYARYGLTASGEDQWWLLEDERVEPVPNIKYLLSTMEIQSNVYLILYQKSVR